MGWLDRLRTARALQKDAGTSIDPSAYASGLAGPMGQTADVPQEMWDSMLEQDMDASTAFAPGTPIPPFFGYNATPRQFNFQTGYNIKSTPRNEPGQVSFQTLASIIDNYDVARMVINRRIDDIRALDWNIVSAPGVKEDVSTYIDKATRLIRRPDGVTPWDSWIAEFLNDVLRFDAGTLYRERTLDGNVAALSVVSGQSIMPLLDYYGRTPKSPAPAYVQFMNGLPWDWMSAEDIVYMPYWPTPESAYGSPPIEWLLVTANTDLRFQWHFLQMFTEGSIPAGFMEAPPDVSNPQQVLEFQEAWDAFLLGDQSKKTQLRWVPAGSKYTPSKDDKFDSSFPEYLLRKVCAAYSVTPNDLGFTTEVNRATSEAQIEVQARISVKPFVKYIEGIINDFLQVDMGLPMVEFSIEEGANPEDSVMTAKARQIYVNMGALSVDEVREQGLGMPVDPAAITPRYIHTPSGPVPLTALAESSAVDTQTAASSLPAGDQVSTNPILQVGKAAQKKKDGDWSSDLVLAIAEAAAPRLLMSLADVQGCEAAVSAVRRQVGKGRGTDLASAALIETALRAVKRHVRLPWHGLRDILATIAIAGFKDGADGARRALKYAAITDAARAPAWLDAIDTIDWRQWRAGQARVAERIAGEGLRSLLEEQRVTIKGIRGTALTDVANTLARGVAAGHDDITIAKAMRSTVADPARALLIARTETSRAVGIVAQEMFLENGVTFERLHLDGHPCPMCIETARQTALAPVPVGTLHPPLHPACMCSLIPVAGDPGYDEFGADMFGLEAVSALVGFSDKDSVD